MSLLSCPIQPPGTNPCYCYWPLGISSSWNTCEVNDPESISCRPGTHPYCSKITQDYCVHDKDCACACLDNEEIAKRKNDEIAKRKNDDIAKSKNTIGKQKD